MMPDTSTPPCRVLVSHGYTVGGTRAATVAAPPERPVSTVEVTAAAPSAIVRRPRADKRVTRPGAGRGCNRKSHVTPERIRELQATGMTAKAIAAQLECSIDLVFQRLRIARKVSPELTAMLCKCPACGEKKYAHRELCRACVSKAYRASLKKAGAPREAEQEA